MRRLAAALLLTLPVLLVLPVLLALAAAARAEIAFSGNAVQGGLLWGEGAGADWELRLEGRPVRVTGEGRFVLGFGRDHGPAAVLEIRRPGAPPETRRIAVAPREFDVQRIDGLPPAMVTPPPEVVRRIAAEAARIADLRRLDTPEPWFESGWRWPAEGRISGVYGSQRILNGEPRQPHFGIDIAVPAGTPVTASTDGRVLLAEDLYFTGGTVLVDHGHGLTGVYSHLETIEVEPGQMLRQGERLGTVGATGRATGPHLDWRVNWFDQRLDPALLAGPMPGS